MINIFSPDKGTKKGGILSAPWSMQYFFKIVFRTLMFEICQNSVKINILNRQKNDRPMS